MWRVVLDDLTIIWRLKYGAELRQSPADDIRKYCIRIDQIYTRWTAPSHSLRQVYEATCEWADWTRFLPGGKHVLSLAQDGTLLLHSLDNTVPPIRHVPHLSDQIVPGFANALTDGTLGMDSYTTSMSTSLVVLSYDGRADHNSYVTGVSRDWGSGLSSR